MCVCASSFLTYKHRPLHIKQFPNRTPPIILSVPFCLFTLACLVISVNNILVGEWCSLRGRHNDTRTDFKWNKIVFLLRKDINQVGYIYTYRCVFHFLFCCFLCLIFSFGFVCYLSVHHFRCYMSRRMNVVIMIMIAIVRSISFDNDDKTF